MRVGWWPSTIRRPAQDREIPCRQSPCLPIRNLRESKVVPKSPSTPCGGQSSHLDRTSRPELHAPFSSLNHAEHGRSADCRSRTPRSKKVSRDPILRFAAVVLLQLLHSSHVSRALGPHRSLNVVVDRFEFYFRSSGDLLDPDHAFFRSRVLSALPSRGSQSTAAHTLYAGCKPNSSTKRE